MNYDVYDYVDDMEEAEFIQTFDELVRRDEFRVALTVDRDLMALAELEVLLENLGVPSRYHEDPKQVEAMVAAVTQRFIRICPERYAFLAFVSDR